MFFLNTTKDDVLSLRCSSPPQLTVSIDTSFATHPNGKSHTGVAVSLGSLGYYMCSSKTQNLVTKSSTEAELAAASDGVNHALTIQGFLHYQGYDFRPIVLLQVNHKINRSWKIHFEPNKIHTNKIFMAA